MSNIVVNSGVKVAPFEFPGVGGAKTEPFPSFGGDIGHPVTLVRSTAIVPFHLARRERSIVRERRHTAPLRSPVAPKPREGDLYGFYVIPLSIREDK